MAIFEKTIRNKNFDKLLRKLEQEIPDSSWSADLEAGSDFKEGDARCSVRVFERYSMMGGNRLSLTLTCSRMRTVRFGCLPSPQEAVKRCSSR